MNATQVQPLSGHPAALVHATAVVLGEAAAPFGGPLENAVLLLGKSGSGKSDVALRLIAAGAKLLADDQILLIEKEGRLFASAPPSLHGRIEIRGAGIVALDALASAPVILAVELEPDADIPRLPESRFYRLPVALGNLEGPTLLTLRPFEASTPAKIAAAASAIARGSFVAGASAPNSPPIF